MSVPASQINLLVVGTPRPGKPYVAGLIAERLIRLGYSVVVLDPEGDHTSLGALRGAIVVGGNSRLLSADQPIRLIAHRFASVVLDMSGVLAPDRADYLTVVLAAIEEHRAGTGLPHWVIVDEAHDPLGHDGAAHAFIEPATHGYCLVTHQPGDLCPEALLGIALPGGQTVEATVRLLAAAGALPRAAGRQLVRQAGPGHAVSVDPCSSVLNEGQSCRRSAWSAPTRSLPAATRCGNMPESPLQAAASSPV